MRLRAPFKALIDGLLFPLLVAAAVFFTYPPSLEHMPRADQVWYLMDVAQDTTFFDLVAHSYSFNRTRHVAPGDTDLFRPVLFFVLASERAIFGNNFMAVQAIGLVLHFAIAFGLFSSKAAGPNSNT